MDEIEQKYKFEFVQSVLVVEQVNNNKNRNTNKQCLQTHTSM